MASRLLHIAKRLSPVGLTLLLASCSNVENGFSFNTLWGRTIPEKSFLSYADFHEHVVGRAWTSKSVREAKSDGTYSYEEYKLHGAQVKASEIFFVTDSTARLFLRPTGNNGRPGVHIDVRYSYDETDNTVTTEFRNVKHKTLILFVDGDDMLTQTIAGRNSDGTDIVLLEHNRAISYKELAHINKDCQLNWDNLEEPRE